MIIGIVIAVAAIGWIQMINAMRNTKKIKQQVQVNTTHGETSPNKSKQNQHSDIHDAPTNTDFGSGDFGGGGGSGN